MKLPPGHGSTPEHYGGFGAKMLAKLGWSSGKGLGKNEDGMADALAPKRREDQAGIGGTKRYPWQEKLWEKSFEAAMKSLPIAMGVPGDSSDSGGDESSSDSDDEPAAGAGDVAQASARRRRAAGASSSSSSSSDGEGHEVLRHGEAVGRDGIFVSGTRAELALARELAKDPWGRFGGRQGKMARIAAAEAAAAIAAGRAPPPPPPPVVSDPEADAVHAARRREERDKRKAEKAAAAKAAKAVAAKAKAEAASRKRARSASPPPAVRVVAEAAAAAVAAAPAQQHWWSRLFHSAGAMLGAEHTARQERGFSEADQEALFLDAHGGKTEGRVGLGRRSDANPLKVGGARWAGNKVAFAADDGDADDADAAEQTADGDGVGADADHAAAAGGLKWRKLAAAALAAAPKGALKEKKLRKAVLAAAAAKLGWHAEAEAAPPGGGAKALKAAFQAADPLSSSRFARLPCGRVALADAKAAGGAAEAEDGDAPRKKKSKKRSG